jgi:phenylalanyl-tRNA synthetase beta chain
MIAEMAGGRILKGALDEYPAKITRDPVALRASRIRRLTGLKVDIDQAAGILRGLQFAVEVNRNEGVLTALPPSFRVDVSREEDLVEEVARHVGYDLVDITLPAWSGAGTYLGSEKRLREIRDTLRGLGFYEAITFSFVNGDRDALFRSGDCRTASVVNPIDVNENQMRTSLLTGVLGSLQHNFNQGQRDVMLFEVGKVFHGAGEDARPIERETVALVMSGSMSPEDWRGRRQMDFYDLKGAVEAMLAGLQLTGFTIEKARVEYLHPGQAASLSSDGVEVARFGRLHPRVAAEYKFRQPVFVAELDFERLQELPATEVRYSALPRLPSISRDVSAFFPATVMWSEIESAVRGLGIEEIASVRLFDVREGSGKDSDEMRSLAFRVTYRSPDRTLTDAEVTQAHERIREMLREKFDARLR